MFDDKYLYPGSNVLRNKQNIRDASQLGKYERNVTSIRIAELRQNPVAGNFDLAHLQKIHSRIFQDVYQWSGELRTVDILKGRAGDRTLFSFTDEIASDAKNFHRKILENGYLRGMDKSEFSNGIAQLYSDLNKIHPFREGNGRASREYFAQLAKQAGYEIDYTKTNKEAWIEASKDAAHGDVSKLSKIFYDISALERAKAFKELPQTEALIKFPELDSSYKHLAVALSKSPSDVNTIKSDLLSVLEQGKLPPSSVTLSESKKVTELAAAARGLIVRDAKGLGGEFSGNVVAVTSRHALLKVGEQIAVRYETGNLARPVIVGESVTILFGQEQSAVTQKNEELHHTAEKLYRTTEMGLLRYGEKAVTRVEYSRGAGTDDVKVSLHTSGRDSDVVMSDAGGLPALLGEANAVRVLADLKTNRSGYLSGETLYDKSVTIDRALELDRGKTVSALAVEDYVKHSGQLVRKPDTDHGSYSGPVVLVTEHHVLQSLGPTVAIQHSLANFLSGENPKAGEKAEITYQQGEASVAAMDRDQTRGFDRSMDHGYGPR